MKRWLRVAVYLFAALFIVQLLLAFALIRDVPSIHDHKAPYCEGKYASVAGTYLAFDQLPPDTLRLFKVSDPMFKWGVVKMLETQMPKIGKHILVHLLRSVLLNIWIKQYSEHELIEFYINGLYFGAGCYGIDVAAKVYFKKELSALSLEETAQLLAMPKAPDEYSVTEHPASNKERASALIEEMKAQALTQPVSN